MKQVAKKKGRPAKVKQAVVDAPSVVTTKLNDCLVTLDRLNQNTMFHLQKCKEETGKITLDDVEYCLNMTTRILLNKYTV